jgi:hypothetical protein
MINNDTRPTISVAVSVDNDCLIPVGITIAVSVDDDGLVVIAVAISVSMGRYTTRSYTDANVVSQNRRYGANARDGAYNEGCADHIGTLLGSTNSKSTQLRARSFPTLSSTIASKIDATRLEPDLAAASQGWRSALLKPETTGTKHWSF